MALGEVVRAVLDLSLAQAHMRLEDGAPALALPADLLAHGS
jgi:hypothetical protein